MNQMRGLYAVMIDLHPRSFRERFAAELMSGFDEGANADVIGFLFRDIAFSLLRQWLKLSLGARSSRERTLATANFPYCDLTDYRPGSSRIAYASVLLLSVLVILQAVQTSPRLLVQSKPSLVVTLLTSAKGL